MMQPYLRTVALVDNEVACPLFKTFHHGLALVQRSFRGTAAVVAMEPEHGLSAHRSYFYTKVGKAGRPPAFL